MFEFTSETLYIIGSSVVGIVIMLFLTYLIRKDWPRAKIIDIIVWATIWAIGGAIVGLADDDIRQSTAILMGAIWGALIAVIQISGWSLRQNK